MKILQTALVHRANLKKSTSPGLLVGALLVGTLVAGPAVAAHQATTSPSAKKMTVADVITAPKHLASTEELGDPGTLGVSTMVHTLVTTAEDAKTPASPMWRDGDTLAAIDPKADGRAGQDQALLG